jgi:hypothetical protein
MTVPDPGFIESLTLPHEDVREHAQLVREWTTAYPNPSPIERGWITQALLALIELRRLARIQATLRTQKVRTANRDWDRAQEDTVAKSLDQFNDHCPSALVELTRSAAGCRWAIDYWQQLALELQKHGTWYGAYRIGAIQLQGKSACVPDLYYSEEAFSTWSDALACQTNPKQKDIDVILDRRNIPKALQDRDVRVWPRDQTEARARMQALVDRELPRLRALEETLRVQYDEPARAEAQVMALASVTQEEMNLLRAQRLHEQSYLQASTALLKVRRQTAAAHGASQARVENSEMERIRGNINPWYLPQLRRGRETLAVQRPPNGDRRTETGAERRPPSRGRRGRETSGDPRRTESRLPIDPEKLSAELTRLP